MTEEEHPKIDDIEQQDKPDMQERFLSFFKQQKYREKLCQMALNGKTSFTVAFQDLYAADPQLANSLLLEPEGFLEHASNAATQQLGIENREYFEKLNGEKKEVTVRFGKLFEPSPLRTLGAEHLNKLVMIEAIVVSATPIRPIIMEAAFKCKKCGTINRIKQSDPFIRTPITCQSIDCGKSGPIFTFEQSYCTFKDSQDLRLQERPEDLPAGQLPRTIAVKLIGKEIVELARPGDHVAIVGIPQAYSVEVPGVGKSRTFTMLIEANSVEVLGKEPENALPTPEEEEKIKAIANDPKVYEKIRDSIAPSIFGYGHIKEAIMYLLFGGVSKALPDINVRGELNTLVVGDPGTAKSQLLQYIPRVAPRGLYTSGRGTTAAGLTASVSRDKTGGLTLEAGALVLSDKGICAIDEMDKMKPDDRVAIHEAMEQHCYDEQTEILTDNGWKFFWELSKRDKVATLKENGMLDFEQPKEIISFRYEGEMVRIKSRQVNLFVTPNHNMYVSICKRANEWMPYSLIKAKDMPKKRMRFKKTAIWHGIKKEDYVIPPIRKYQNSGSYGAKAKGFMTENKTVKMDDWLEFLGYYVSEGSLGSPHKETRTRYRVTLTQKEGTEVSKKMIGCIKRMGFTASVNGNHIEVNSKQLATHIEELRLGKAPDKYIPWEIKQLCSKQLRILFDALVDGDGYIRKSKEKHRGYVTSSMKLMGDFQEICLKIGLAANSYLRLLKGTLTRVPNGKVSKTSENIYELSVISGKCCYPSINYSKYNHVTTEHYQGQVYCAEVTNHTLFVRRHGKPVWCGNTVSVAKGGIIATLNARTSILAAANPTFGRYEPCRTVAENISALPITILSRFDLIFVLRDVPEKSNDTRMSKHILSIHQNHVPPAEPPINASLLRKYITYAKSLEPRLNAQAFQKLADFYLAMRSTTESEGSPIAITARQLESLVRIAEARARAGLRTEVTAEDAEAAIAITKRSLEEVGIDVATGRVDIDITMTGKPKSVRDKMNVVFNVYNILRKEVGSGTVEKDELVAKMEELKQIPPSEGRRLIDQLLKEGSFFEPKEGSISKT